MQYIPVENSDIAHRQYMADKAEMRCLFTVTQYINGNFSAMQAHAAGVDYEALASLYSFGLLSDSDLERAAGKGVITSEQKAHIIAHRTLVPKTFVMEHISTGHRWGEWESAGTDEDGREIRRRTCQVCSFVQTSTGDDYED